MPGKSRIVWLSWHSCVRKVVVNGKDVRAWSVLRTEIQQILVKSHEKAFQIPAGKGDKHDGKSALSAMELAELLTQDFLQKPAETVEFGEGLDEEDLHGIQCSILTES